MSSPFALTDTPVAVVDLACMQRNIQRMQHRMNEMGVRFRPHVKTTKCLPIIQQQLAAGACGITVSTLKEAEFCFENGIVDILYGVAIPPGKLAQASALVQQGCSLSLITDSCEGARAIVEFSAVHSAHFEVWIEIDSDGHRSGLKVEDPQLIEVAKILADGGIRLLGVITHAGSSYQLNSSDALQALAEQERQACVSAAQRLRDLGFACEQVSIGSTPTALSAQSFEGVTEVRAGVYVFFDLVMHNIGVCTLEDLALSVLTTVIGHQVEKNWIIIDAGWMAMSRDRGTQAQCRDYAYGQVCTESGEPIAGALLSSANQEHGIITFGEESALNLATRFPVGSRLRILPNHACATGAQHPHYHVFDASGAVVSWQRIYGW